MNLLQKDFHRAATELGLLIELNHDVKLSDGRILRAQVWLPDLGNVSGTLVFSFRDDVDSEARRELKERAFLLSTMGDGIPGVEFDLDRFVETFSEWGWCGDPERTPAWIKEIPPAQYH